MKTKLFKMARVRQSLGKWSPHRFGALCTALCLLVSMLVGLSGQILAEHADPSWAMQSFCLYISAFLPTMAGAGYFESQIPLVRTRDQATALATFDLFGNEILGYGMVSPQAALNAARKHFLSDDQDRSSPS